LNVTSNFTLEPNDRQGGDFKSDLSGAFQLSANGEWEPWDPQQKTRSVDAGFQVPAHYNLHAKDDGQTVGNLGRVEATGDVVLADGENRELGSVQEDAQHENHESQYDSRFHSIVSDRTSIQTFLTARSKQTTGSRNSAASNLSNRTPWRQTLHEKNLIPPKIDETDWSGRGQHAEFGPDEESTIDELLIPQGELGRTSTALVEKVRCRRIMLARKQIWCNRRLKREDAIQEVAHLQRLVHAHVVRCVGTYVYGKELSILLYPATAYNLETFLDRYADLDGRIKLSIADGKLVHDMRTSILKFFKCLASTIIYTHEHLVKHMDVKPRNLLIRARPGSSNTYFHIYLADFGIARSYTRLSEAETDSYTSFTRTYSAPEVVRQDKRGLPADIFSLGCVFLEMLAVYARKKGRLTDIRKSNSNGDTSYQANLDALRTDEWLLQDHVYESSRHRLDEIRDITVQMLDRDPDLRPDAHRVLASIGPEANECCTKGPTRFVAVMPSEKNTTVLDALGEQRQGNSSQ